MEPPETLSGRYRVGPSLGHGGMADVFEGEDLRLGRPVALKILRSELGRDPDIRRRFEAEARFAASLSHPNIVSVYDVGEDAGLAYLVMELLPGRSLADRIRRGPLPEAEAVDVIRAVLSALAAAHAAGLLHRDIKPGNILLAADGTAKVTDFGIAKAVDPEAGSTAQTTANLVVGTPSYIAPERMRGEPASVASDIWAVGAVLYEALSGVPPFAGETAVATAVAAEQGRMKPLRDVNPGVSPAVQGVTQRALRPVPGERFPSAGDMLEALAAAGPATVAMTAPLPPATVAMAATEARTAMVPPAAAPPPGIPPRRGMTGRQMAIVGLVILLLALLIAAVVLALSSQKNPPPSRTTTTVPPSSTTIPSTTTSTTAATTTTTTLATTTTTQGTTTTTSTPTTVPTTAPGPTTSVSVGTG
ncbi:MAG TPA: serine/threonine-protein kinase [Acidimicrobiales bacterium]|nr:serine/threonine-protein kinase [Acidimicrobiales bacterium]